MVLEHFLLTSAVNWYNPAHTNRWLVRIISSYLIQSSQVTKAFLMFLSSVFLRHMCSSNINFNVMVHRVAFKGCHGTPCHLMRPALTCGHFLYIYSVVNYKIKVNSKYGHEGRILPTLQISEGGGGVRGDFFKGEWILSEGWIRPNPTRNRYCRGSKDILYCNFRKIGCIKLRSGPHGGRQRRVPGITRAKSLSSPYMYQTWNREVLPLQPLARVPCSVCAAALPYNHGFHDSIHVYAGHEIITSGFRT